MTGYIGVTDQNWFESHRLHNRSEVIFWRRAQVPVDLDSGDYFFFLVKGDRLVKGYGIVSEIGTETIQALFEKYGLETGWNSIEDATNIMGKSDNEEIGYYVLRDVQYFEDSISLEEIEVDFKLNIVSGRRIDEDEAMKILEALGKPVVSTKPTTVVLKPIQKLKKIGYVPELTLEAFLARVPHQIENDLKLIQKQLVTPIGRIDLLCKDKNDCLVVVEEKTRQTSDEVVGQISRYMTWVKENKAREGEDVRGIIIVMERDKKLEYAARANPKIRVKILVDYNFTFEDL